MSLVLLPLFLLSVFRFSNSATPIKIGVNYGQLGNNLPPPSHSIDLIQSLKAQHVKIYDANPQILKSLSTTNIQVSIMVPNELLANISTNQTLSNQWVHTNLLPFIPQTKIRHLLVGNEILSPQNRQLWPHLVPSMRRMGYSLRTHNIKHIKVGTPVATDVLESKAQSPSYFPPSSGIFRSDISESVMKPMLRFLNRTKSFFFLDAYTYFPWSENPQHINLDYALFNSRNITYTDPVNGLLYTNLLDQMLDSVIFAMKKLGFRNIPLFLAETGWPTGGDIDQIGANIYNAAIYNRNLIKRVTAVPAYGTPARPFFSVPVLIFALYNENQKSGPGTERNWGLLYPNGTRVYDLDLTGKLLEFDYKPLPAPANNEPYKGKIWCVVAEGVVNVTKLGAALKYACGQGNGTCNAIQPRKECYRKGNLVWQASYAFASYWKQFRSSSATCYFDGLAIQTTKNPSRGSCMFPSVTL